MQNDKPNINLKLQMHSRCYVKLFTLCHEKD